MQLRIAGTAKQRCHDCCHFKKAHGTGNASHWNHVCPHVDGVVQFCTDAHACVTSNTNKKEHKDQRRKERDELSNKGTLISERIRNRIEF